MKKRIVISADEGKVLTNGEIYGRVIYLAEGMTEEDFHEITDAEYEDIMAKEAVVT
jgi:hypothetical protein